MQEDLAIEFPSKPELPPMSLPSLLGSTSNADSFSDFFIPDVPRLQFHCTDPIAFPAHFDSFIEPQLSVASRVWEPNF